jgi:KDO2-lipid IV(A) lauroyltransferase
VIICALAAIGSRLTALLPRRLCYLIAVRVADICFHVFYRKRRALERNLSRVMPQAGGVERRRTARAVFHNFARYLVDFVSFRNAGVEELSACVQFSDLSRLDAAFRNGRGIILVTAHLGNWDIGAAALAARRYPATAVVKRFPDARLERFVAETRAHLHLQTISSGRAGPGLVRALQRGEMLALAIDEPRPASGVKACFFGEEIRAPTGPARLALRTGARIMPAIVVRTDKRTPAFEAIVDTGFSFVPSGDSERDIRALTQALLCALEANIRRHPDQWYMFRPLWASARRSRRRRYTDRSVAPGRMPDGQVPLPAHRQ